MTNHRIITAPVRLTGSIHPQQLASLVAIDAMVRRTRALGGPPTTWELTTVVGDVAVQRAVQRAVAREGDDRDELGREGFAARARQLEGQAADDLRRLLVDLRVQADLDHWGFAAGDAARLARIAFVRLYEAGVLQRSDAVLDSCPSCETVVDDADADEVEMDVDHVRLVFPVGDGSLEVETSEPELLVGAVAIAVPADQPVDQASVYLPLLEAEVPVVAVEGLSAPALVVPGHDRWSHDLARQLGTPVVEVLDGEGVVRHPGPLEGLGRYAARTAATEQLHADGYVSAHFRTPSTVKRCYRCGTVLVPLLGRHWILALRDLIEPVAQAVLDGSITVSPPSAVDRFLGAAGQSTAWCVSQQLWSGEPIPVSTCLDCNQVTVSVEESTECGSCMGTLSPHPDVLDARFIAAVTPLGMMGWPHNLEEEGQVRTTLAVGPVGLDAWALPIAALGMRLAGRIPFDHVIVHHAMFDDVSIGQRSSADLIEVVEEIGPAVARVALLAGDLDREHAGALVAEATAPHHGFLGSERDVEAYDAALVVLDATGVLRLLMAQVGASSSEAERAQLAAMVEPLTGVAAGPRENA